MKFAPRHNMAIGRMVIKKSESQIIRVDETKVTKFILVDAVGADAAASGIKVGDLVVVNALGNIVLDAGTVYLPVFEEKNVVFFVKGVDQKDLLVQTSRGDRFVPFDSEIAAKPFGVPPEVAEAAQ